MRFMLLVKSDAKIEAGGLPSLETIAAMGKFNDELTKAGALLAAEGLKPTSKGARIRNQGGKITVVDGPFTEAKEIIAGFWMLKTTNREEAVEWMKRCPAEEELELRQVFEVDDFAKDESEKPGGWRDTEQSFRDDHGPAGGVYGGPKPGSEKRLRFIHFMKGDAGYEAGKMPEPKVLEAMGKLMDTMAKQGVLLAGEGLAPSSKSSRTQTRNGKRGVVDGPFSEAKEMVGGYSLIQVGSREEAIEWATRVQKVAGEGESELREVFEPSDVEAQLASAQQANK